ncbi:MAG TPA: DNA-directed RNA polymerase subunit omega [Thermoguttaceae bacterium]|nr:DNA-directed RNA polymerase subunit omega [Thermoguttaceae bacterium]
MLDDLRDEKIINKVGGRFRLSTLIQKRLVALNGGSRPLVECTATEDRLQVVIREILEDKVYLDMDSNLRIADSQYNAGGSPELDLDSL